MNCPTRCHSRRRSRRTSAFTLVELLISLAVVLLLAGLTLPTFKGMLKDQRVTQSARVVQSMAESARARAIALGRPVALIFDRVAIDPTADPVFNLVSDNICTRLSIGEVFPPYEGDWAGTTGALSDVAIVDGVPDTLSIELAKVSSLMDMSTTPPSPTGLVDVGDLIQLGDRAQLFSITSLTVTTTPSIIVHIGFSNPPPGYSTAEPLWSTSADQVRFRMIRRPSKTLAGSVAIPRGLCVDLSESGMGVAGNEFAVGLRPAASEADRFGPLFVVFNTRGNVDGVYYRRHRSPPETTADEVTFVASSPTGVMHFLVGRTEQVQPAGALPVSDRDDFRANLYDPTNIWISINPFNGAIYSTPNATIPAGTPALDRVEARAFAINALNARGS